MAPAPTTGRAGAVSIVQLGATAATRPDLPGLERTGAKLARGLTAACAALGGASKIGSIEIRIITFAEWKAAQLPVVAVARFRDRAIKGGFLLSVPTALIASLVDVFYGGDGAVEGTTRPFCAAERRLFDRFAKGAGEALAAGWADVTPLAPALTASSFAAEDVALGKPGDVIVNQRFTLADPGPSGGAIEIIYPLAALRGIAGLQGASDVAAEEIDPLWRMRLSDAVKQARLPVRTVIARPTVALSRLIALAPGDFIPVTLPARVPLTVAGRLLAHGTIGEANGRAAIMIDKLEQGALSDA